MSTTASTFGSEDAIDPVNQLVDEQRDRALWFLRPDYYPETDAERLQVLEYIEQRSDVAVFRRVAQMRKCLLLNSSVRSVGS